MKPKKTQSRFCALSALLTLPLLSNAAFAAGKKPTDSSGSGSGGASSNTPNPVRAAHLRPVKTQAFNLPNQYRVDLTTDLNQFLLTAVANTSSFSALDSSNLEANACEPSIQIRAALTSFELNLTQFGIKVGYSPSGENTSPIKIEGRVNGSVGLIAMDFSLYDCVGERCQAIAASSSTHHTVQANIGLDLDFGVVKTGPELIHNTSLGTVFRRMIENGVANLANSNRLSELPWRAHVLQVFPGDGTVLFDAGVRNRLATQQTFTIYRNIPGANNCDAYIPVAHIRSSSVDTVSSFAQVETSIDAQRGIQVGDTVMVRVAPR